jgi:hypothetical protein
MPKRSFIVKSIHSSRKIEELTLNESELNKTQCSYLFDLAAPKFTVDIKQEPAWTLDWYILFDDQLNDQLQYEFDIGWLELSRRVDDKLSTLIELPLQSGYEVSDEIQFDFFTSAQEQPRVGKRKHLLFFSTSLLQGPVNSPAMLSQAMEQSSYVKLTNSKSDDTIITPLYLSKNKDITELFATISNVSDKQAYVFESREPFSLKIRRNNKWSIKFIYKQASGPGDCDFNEANLCGYELNPFVNDRTMYENLASARMHNSLSTIVHMARANERIAEVASNRLHKKLNDFYLSIRRSSNALAESILYSPLIENRSAKTKFNSKIYSLSFDYLLDDKWKSFVSLIVLNNRTSIAQPIGSKFAHKSIDVNKYSYLLSSSQSSRLRPKLNWHRVDNMPLHSCDSFRFGFSIKYANMSGNIELEQLGIDNIQIDYDKEASECEDKSVCNGNGQCFNVDARQICCCEPGFEVENCE